MHEAVAFVLIFIILMGMALGAVAYALPNLVVKIRSDEVSVAIAYLKRVAQNTGALLSQDAASSTLSFSFTYGVLTLARSGYVSVKTNNMTLYAATPHYVFQYVGPVGGFPAAHVLDRGVAERAFFASPDGAALVYHYSQGGRTYATADQKVALATESQQSLTVIHILILQLLAKTGGTLAAKRGPIQLVLNAVQCSFFQVAGPATIRVQSGLDSAGGDLTNSLVASTLNVQIFLNVISVTVMQG